MNIQANISNPDIPERCRYCVARRHGICGTLDDDQLIALSRHATQRKVGPGTTLVGDGEAIAIFSNVLAGTIKLTKTLADGRQQIVGLQFAPDFVGSLFRVTSSCTAEAATKAMLCTFPKAVVERMIAESPRLRSRLMEQALKELDEARSWMLTLAQKTASEKIASFLLLIAGRPGAAHGPGTRVAVELPLSRGEIGDFLGMTIETVSRQLTRLSKNGMIRFQSRRRLVINDISYLERCARL
ncbi:Crp/Fnr family transcriptional regulator [Pseudaminobacter arsenicus]|uniref:Crp/Fnr family transcriptional regulator n=1 Tax=Borborobacter arsenicus TaxID=1851146 RepID=A0A432UZE4_9HYPH|nr:Crp/Fnr family transcriptional regulator [Pseudaminobacter arsenicus]RUM95182.1 Crp/Fnr family transcriptional regulator [Pseudaminobacter arsenicus]